MWKMNYYNQKIESIIKNPHIDFKNFVENLQDLLLEIKPREQQKYSNKKYQVLDFFSGAGGMSLGFSIIPDFKIVGGCDLNKDACSTYQKNFGVNCENIDIQDIATGDISIEDFLSKFPEYDQDIPLIIIGCPPCQGFSAHRKKNWSEDDERNSLVGLFASIAVKLNPTAIIIENVPEMLSKKYWHHFQSANSVFKKNHYLVKQSIYNSATFGVPQEKFRSIVIAMKREFELPTQIYDNYTEFMTVREAIGDLPAISPGERCISDPFHRCANHKKSTLRIIKSVPKNGGSRPEGIGGENWYADVYGRLFWDKPSITITGYSRNPASGRYVHPEQDRGLSMREAALLQSFPKNFLFIGSIDSIFKQIGEAVPPKMACGIASSIYLQLLGKSHFSKTKINIQEPVSNSFSSQISKFKSTRRNL